MKNADKKSKVLTILKKLGKAYPDTDIALNFSAPHELLFAVILSAQCTDAMVNKTTAILFQKYKTISDYADADIKELENIVHQCGFYHNKAKNIKKSAQMLIDNFSGKVPQNMDDLQKLAGVARKTANIVMSSAFGKQVGIAVDTHVIRIGNILKLTKNADPVKIEQDLMQIVPQKQWKKFSFLIQTLGRRACKARTPNCAICPIKPECKGTKPVF
ncbi:MAG: endonuclease III [Elusimicrobiota bacterium]|jgi:endonuclease-3|nr:endonuclease III [Elusimicrobiota bacterium]